jgi:hypothetical protein
MQARSHRLTQWTDRKIDSVHKMALLGMSEEAMADVLEVPRVTFNYWKKTRPEFKKALDDAKLGASTMVVEAFLACCLGYDYQEEVAVYDRSEHAWKKTLITRHRPADPWSQAKYLSLKNRNEGWSETQRIQIDHNTNINVQFSTISTALLTAIELEAQKILPQNAGDNSDQ